MKFLIKHADISLFSLQYEDVSLLRHHCDITSSLHDLSYDILYLISFLKMFFKTNFSPRALIMTVKVKCLADMGAHVLQCPVCCCEV